MPQSPCRGLRHCSGLRERDNWPECASFERAGGTIPTNRPPLPPPRPRSQTPGSEMQSQGPRGPRRVRLVLRASPPPRHRLPPLGSGSLSLTGRWGGRRLPAGSTQPGRATPQATPRIPPPRLPPTPAPPPLPAGGSSRRRPPLPGPSGRRAGRQGGRRERAPRRKHFLMWWLRGAGAAPGGLLGTADRLGTSWPRWYGAAAGTWASSAGRDQEGRPPALFVPQSVFLLPEKEVIPLPVGQTLCLPDFPAFVGKRP